MATFLQSTEGVVEEIMRIHRSLPARLSIDEVEAARTLILNVEREEQARIDAISKQRKGNDVPNDLFSILLDMQRNLVAFQSKEQKREADKLMDLENIHGLFDEFVQTASKCIPGSENYEPPNYSNGSISTVTVSKSSSVAASKTSGYELSKKTSGYDSPSVIISSSFRAQRDIGRSGELFTRDDSYVKKTKSTFRAEGIAGEFEMQSRGAFTNTAVKSVPNVGEDGDKLSFMRLANLIEVSAKKGTRELILQNKLMDQIEWLPDSIGKLSKLVTLDLSENRIVALPVTIGSLSALTKLDLHSNRVAEIPECIGDLLSLVYLDLRGNQLTVLPPLIGKLSCLAELDLSSNRLVFLPETIGNLISLKKLNIETNDIEELPHTIGHCSSLVELRADYNRLKALPEAVGRLQTLEILSIRYNNIKLLPTTMASMSNLKELDVSFNELEAVPEGLCLATTLIKMNIGNNFADMQSLPRSIGNLDMLEELDISNNQIHVLPDSFAMLSKLRLLRVEENPLEVPPRHIAEMGAVAVVQYMTDLVAKRDVKTQPVKQKSGWAQFCFFSRPKKRKHDGLDYVKA